jgi:GntR family galactonate operon transcriptional repressor
MFSCIVPTTDRGEPVRLGTEVGAVVSTVDRPRGLHDQVVDALGGRILSGAFAPGTVLDLPTLAEGFGVSRTVIREAMKVLTAKGLVAARQKRGTYVTEPETWNMLDDDVLRWRLAGGAGPALFEQLAEIRMIVEPAAAALAARRATDDDLATLRSCVQEMKRTGVDPDAEQAADADLAFHATLLLASHNDLLAGLRSVIEHALRQRDMLVHTHAKADDRLPSHQAVLDAVERRDPEAASTAMRVLLEEAAADLDAAQMGDTHENH